MRYRFTAGCRGFATMWLSGATGVASTEPPLRQQGYNRHNTTITLFVGRRRRPTVPKWRRKSGFTCINMIVRPSSLQRPRWSWRRLQAFISFLCFSQLNSGCSYGLFPLNGCWFVLENSGKLSDWNFSKWICEKSQRYTWLIGFIQTCTEWKTVKSRNFF